MATPMKQKKLGKNKSSSSPLAVRKKKLESNPTDIEGDINIGMDIEDSRDSPLTVSVTKAQVFKDPNFVHSSIGTSGSKKTRVWKNLKQIVSAERALPWQPTDTTYGMIDAPPSFKPHMKYSDLSGLAARYTDPQTKLRYTTPEEYSRIRMMPSDLVSGCLLLRKANIPV